MWKALGSIASTTKTNKSTKQKLMPCTLKQSKKTTKHIKPM
jgi:hypothetical protein